MIRCVKPVSLISSYNTCKGRRRVSVKEARKVVTGRLGKTSPLAHQKRPPTAFFTHLTFPIVFDAAVHSHHGRRRVSYQSSGERCAGKPSPWGYTSSARRQYGCMIMACLISCCSANQIDRSIVSPTDPPVRSPLIKLQYLPWLMSPKAATGSPTGVGPNRILGQCHPEAYCGLVGNLKDSRRRCKEESWISVHAPTNADQSLGIGLHHEA